MQPELNDLSHNKSLTQHTSEGHHDGQYGFDQSPLLSHLQPCAGEERVSARRSASPAASSTASAADSDKSSTRSLRGLSPPSRLHSSSPVNRINEHERASRLLSKRRRHGPAFTVVRGSKAPTLGSTELADFPNEVMTHILSHLPPPSLTDVALVSRRFHHLVTTPHAWRIAFSRFFPGAEALTSLETGSETSEQREALHSERRLFTRLTAIASWRSEYILRTRLLRSIARGKPLESPQHASTASPRSSTGSNSSAHVAYNSDLVTTVDRLHGCFGQGISKRLPRFIHGATDVGMASSSDPKTGKVDTWGFADGLVSQQFADSHPGEVPYGLGAGDVVGVPNTMDVSQTYGLIYAEGYPGGRAYYRSIEEKRGRHLACPLDQTNLHQPESGIPSIRQSAESLCSVWISKTGNIPDMSCGFVGMLVGSSQGILSSYSLGTNGLLEKRLDRGELTARWVLSPGVPITAIAVDETFSIHRQSLNRFWAIVLNALGEVFYIVDFPIASTRPVQQIGSRSYPVAIETLAWDVGRTVHWMLVEPTRRTARLDPFDKAEVDGSYTPRSSWHGVGLNKEQIAEETREINSFLQKKPKDFQKMCHGWDMRRRLEVDFSSGDKHGAGESIIIISCGLDEGQHAGIKRYTHYKLKESFGGGNRPEGQTSIFDSGNSVDEQRPNQYSKIATLCRHNSATFSDLSEAPLAEEWRSSIFVFGGLKVPQINTTAIDMSSIAMMTMTEDPLLCLNESSVISSPMSPPPGQMPFSKSATDVPGQRARLLAVGTTNGTIILWNMRAPTANNDSLENNVNPLRVIYTDSPQISCLAMTALYLVHGGNDGLVQAWDPLASNTDPIRTLNSRFSSRARRRLIQAEVSPAGVGINLFAAGAICLDPDPTMLRGMVSLGSYLRYWSYSSQAADQYKGNKRRLRRSERGSNQASDRFSGTGRGALKDYIANEKLELEREKRIRRKDEERLSGRYGVDLLGPGATEDEILAYATMLSEEAHQSDELRRQSSSNSSSSGTITEEAVASPVSGSPQEDLDHDLAEAIRLSLEDSNGFRASGLGNNDASASMFAVRYGKKKKLLPLSSSPPSDIFTGADRGASPPVAELDLEFALQLSQAEEQNLANKAEGSGKGKGRSKS